MGEDQNFEGRRECDIHFVKAAAGIAVKVAEDGGGGTLSQWLSKPYIACAPQPTASNLTPSPRNLSRAVREKGTNVATWPTRLNVATGKGGYRWQSGACEGVRWE